MFLFNYINIIIKKSQTLLFYKSIMLENTEIISNIDSNIDKNILNMNNKIIKLFTNDINMSSDENKKQLLLAIHENDGYLPLARTDNYMFYQFTRYPLTYMKNQKYILMPYDIVNKLYLSYRVIKHYLDHDLNLPYIDKNTKLYTFIIPMEILDELDYEVNYQQISVNQYDYDNIYNILSN